MHKRLLITGGSGLLGLNWARSVRDKFRVTSGIHNRKYVLKGVSSEVLNLDSFAGLVIKLKGLSPDIVIHTVGLTDVEKCETEPELAYHTNVTLALNVSKACKLLGIKFVHISTDHLFNGETSFVNEDCKVSPLNVYAKTKAKAESTILQTNSDALVIRTNFFGWGTYYRRSFSDIIT